jgi:hypothetical protein
VIPSRDVDDPFLTARFECNNLPKDWYMIIDLEKIQVLDPDLASVREGRVCQPRIVYQTDSVIELAAFLHGLSSRVPAR